MPPPTWLTLEMYSLGSCDWIVEALGHRGRWDYAEHGCIDQTSTSTHS